MTSATARIVLKSPREIELMRAAGRVLAQVLDAIERCVRPGVTTGELNEVAERELAQAGARALFKNYKIPEAKIPFPASICTSVNEQVVHGIPGPLALKEGDIVSIDCGLRLKGYCADSARTIAVGRIAGEAQRLVDQTRACLKLALELMQPGVRWSAVAARLQSFAAERRLGVVRKYVGHGIGREMHEPPSVPNYFDVGARNGDFDLVPGMTLAVEPMLTLGRPAVEVSGPTSWPVVTRDGSLAAHFEHTVAVMPDGISVLTDGS